MNEVSPSGHICIACGIPLRDGKILLGLRAEHRKAYPNCWDLIGGHVELGETPEAAFRRELIEEIGIHPCNYALVDELLIATEQGTVLKLFIYRVDAWSGGEPFAANDEHSRLEWFDIETACEIANLADDAYVTLFRHLAAAQRTSKLLP